MRYKKWIIVSTIVVFALVVVLTSLWLTRVREVEVKIISADEVPMEKYDFVDKTVSSVSLGKQLPFINVSEIKREIEKDSYLSVLSIEKKFPCRVSACVKLRKGYFSIFTGGKYYLLDDEFALLDFSDNDLSKGGVIPIETNNISLDFTSFEKGSVIDYGKDVLFSAMVEIFAGVRDRFNTVDKIIVNGNEGGVNRDRVYFVMKTGVALEFRFSDPSGGRKKDDYETGKRAVIKSVVSVNDFYENLDEKKKSEGFIITYLTDGYEVKTVYNSIDR